MLCLVATAALPILAWTFVGWMAGGLLPSRGVSRGTWWWLVVALPTMIVLAVATSTVLVATALVRPTSTLGKIHQAYARAGSKAVEAARGVLESMAGLLLGWVPVLGPLLVGVK